MYSMCVHVCVSERVFAVNLFMESGAVPCCTFISNPVFFIESVHLQCLSWGLRFFFFFFFLKVSVSPLPLVCKDIFSG